MINSLKDWWKYNIWEGVLGPCGICFGAKMATWGMEHGRFQWLPYIFQKQIVWAYNRWFCWRTGHAYEIDFNDGCVWTEDEDDLVSWTHLRCMSCCKRVPKDQGERWQGDI